MQQNPALAGAKIAVTAVFATLLGLVFFQYRVMEEKVGKTYDRVGGLETGVAELRRQVETTAGEIKEAREAAILTKEHSETLVRLAGEGLFRSTDGGGERGGGPEVPPAKRTTRQVDRTSAPSVIAGVEIYPYNAGWTVVCDGKANADPKADLPPADQIDWEGVLNDYTPGEPKGWNFLSDDRTTTVSALSYYIHDFLAERKIGNVQEYRARLAERIEESPDRTTYMIYLRKGVRWHDPESSMLAEHPWLRGERFVTAKDVKFTFDLLRHEQTATPLKVYYEEVSETEAIDEYTVRVTWKRPNFYARAQVLELQPIPYHIWAFDPDGNPYGDPDVYAQFGKHWFGKSMCGNGPYRFVEYKRGEYVRCIRNEGFWERRPTCKEYYVHIIRDDDSRLARFWNKGTIVHIFNPPQYRRFVLEGDPNKPLHRYERFDRPAPKEWENTYFIWRRPTYGGFGWNMRKPLFEDKRVRRALTLALNRPAVPEKFFDGLGEVIPIGESVFSPYFNDKVPVLPFDVEKAKALLEEAGWKDSDGDGIRDRVINGKKVDFEFSLLISSASQDQLQICQMYKGDLLKAGIKLTPDPAEGALWSQKIHNREFDGFIIFWTAGFDSDPRQLWDSRKKDDSASNNYTGFGDPEADALFEKLVTTFDYPSRIALMHRWYEIEHEAQPYTWIWSIHSPVVIDADWRIPEPKLTNPQIDRRLIFRWKDRK